MTEVSTRELLQELTESPITTGARASKIFLPAGKRSASGRETREARKALRERQIDLEDAVEAAGGYRGALGVRS